MASPAPATLPRRTPALMLRAVDGAPPASGGRDFTRRATDVGVPVTGPLSAGALVVDLASYVVTLDGKEVDVSPRQVELLALFLGAPRKVWSRDQLHWVCWGDTTPSRRVDVQLCRLRAKTGLDLFRNVRDRGWALRQIA